MVKVDSALADCPERRFDIGFRADLYFSFDFGPVRPLHFVIEAHSVVVPVFCFASLFTIHYSLFTLPASFTTAISKSP
jgi:hypothetical protein